MHPPTDSAAGGSPEPHRIETEEATAADVSELARMHQSAKRLTSAIPKAGPLVEELSRGDDAESVVESFSAGLADEGVTVLVGYLGEVAVGYGVLTANGSRGRIDELWVEPDARRIGVGTALLHALRELAAAAQMSGIDSVALPGDRDTKNFFEDHAMVARAIIVGTSEL
ncbi:MAG: GNAT family N-acetyltransferase [Microthrixaceae bacterium]